MWPGSLGQELIMQFKSVKKTVFYVDKLSLYNLLRPVIHKHVSNMLPSVPTLPLNTLPFPYTSLPSPYLFPDFCSMLCLKCTLYTVHPSIYLQFSFAYYGSTNQNNQLWLGGSELHSKLWFFICIISCFVVE